MGSCPNCHSSEIEYDGAQGNSVCIRCGAVVEENAVVSELTFNELANGSSVLEGQFIAADRGKSALPTIFGRRVAASIGADPNRVTDAIGESREATLANGRRRIQALAGAVGLGGEHYIDAAHRWYSLALQHQFTRGRRGPNVIAACLYIVCRQERTPHMLLDFSDVLSTSVYSLGGTFLRLVRLLNLEIPIVDPSFYVARFAARLEFDEKTAQVANSALRLVARMKRDWIQTGRRPAGVCAAGLIIAARMHGFRRTEAEVVRVVRICEATLRKRLEEFGRTPSSQLTPEEFEGIWLEQEADPPAFTHTRSKPAEPDTVHILPSVLLSNLLAHSQAQLPLPPPSEAAIPLTPPPSQSVLEKDGLEGQQQAKGAAAEEERVGGEEENLSDLELDEEMESMLLTKEEIGLKTRLWTELNRDYLEREAEREKLKIVAEAQLGRVAASADENYNVSTAENQQPKKPVKEGYESRVVEAAASHPLPDQHHHQPPSPPKEAKPRTTRKRTRLATGSGLKSENGVPVAATAAEAAKQVLQNKKFSKKINYEALDELFTASAASATSTVR